MKKKTNRFKGFLIIILGVFIFALMMFLLLLFLTYAPQLAEKVSFGQSSSSFCQEKDGVYRDNLFSGDSCFIDGTEHKIYNKDGEWILAK